MKPLRTLLVDDERLARARLRRLLSTEKRVNVVAEARSVAEALDILRHEDIDIIFLDIEMPGGSGFELFKAWSGDAAVVFVTAFDAFALRAFDVNAADYLVKPVDPERLSKTLERLASDASVRRPSTASPQLEQISVQTRDGTRVMGLHEVVCISSADDYTEIVDTQGTTELSSTPLWAWEEQLEELGFCRIHRQTLINLRHIENLERSGGTWSVGLSPLTLRFPVGRRRLSHLRETMASLSVTG